VRPLRVVLLAAFACIGVLTLGAARASAATCSEYSNQADAQRAADTRDGDGDGIYCEALPCPCLKPGGGGGTTPTKAKPKKRAQVIQARITSVVDGDTIKVRAFHAARDYYTVRLVGVDTPETKRPGTAVECGGKEATASMFRLAFTESADSDGDGLEDTMGGDGRKVTLITDPSQDTFDRYQRLLAYVTTAAGRNLQREQLSRGWANVYVYNGHPFRRVASFRSAQASAKKAGRGVWGQCDGDFHTPA
jgi:micrococcal nuclease